MNHCNTCAHWDRKYPIEPDQRLCLAKKLDSSDRDGARVAFVEKRYAVFLATSPEFGCVHHTPAAGVPAFDESREREAFEATFRTPTGVEWNGSAYALPAGWECTIAARRFIDQWEAWKARAALGVDTSGETSNV